MTKTLHDIRCPKCNKLACKTATKEALIEVNCRNTKCKVNVFTYDNGVYYSENIKEHVK